MRSLRSILGIRWQENTTNLEVLNVESVSFEAMLLKAQLRWTGLVIRMEEDRMPRKLLYRELCSVQFSSAQIKTVSMRSGKNIIMRSTPSLRNFPNVAFETVPMLV